MIVTASMKMADLIIQNHHLLSIIDRFGIQIGIGERTIAEVCEQHQIPVDFFLEIVNAFNDPSFFPKRNLDSFPLHLIVSYLFKTHSFYLELKIPEIERLIKKLLDSEKPETVRVASLIFNFFSTYTSQLRDHIAREEKIVYPYILKLEEVYESKDSAVMETFRKEFQFTIDEYERDHEDIEEKLYDIKSLIIKYVLPGEDYLTYYKILGQIDHLEQDINDHTEMENKVLIPRVRMMESFLNQRTGQ